MTETLFVVFALVFGVTVHEFSHALAAYRMGDDTARLQGRLTINPIPHLDPFGSVVLPVLLAVLNTGFFFAYAKPVPINPMNFRHPRRGMMISSLAGPLSNVVVAILFALLFRGLVVAADADFGDQELTLAELAAALCFMTVRVNLALALFNMIPLPPLDGGHVLQFFLPLHLAERFEQMGHYGFLIIILLLQTPLFGWYFQLVRPVLWVLTEAGL